MASIPNQYFVDTNILLRLADAPHPLHKQVTAALAKLNQGIDSCLFYVAPQNYVEFWNVATRPIVKNGFGLSVDDAKKALDVFDTLFILLPESSIVHVEWRRLVIKYGVMGVQVHDARLAATMIGNGLSHIITLNGADFRRYAPEGIIPIDPLSL